MNYRHAYHAGSFSDVLKHVVLTLVIDYLKRKDKPFRVIDTHAGIGRYDLAAEGARTGEYLSGIANLFGGPDMPEALRPYLEVVESLNDSGSGGSLRWYPGSPLLVRSLLRERDRLTAVELHPDDHATLAAEFDGDVAVKVRRLDGFLALKAFVPPKERRGLVLVDPAYEARDDFHRLADGLEQAWRRWPTGIYLAWYPVKEPAEVEAFRRRVAASALGPSFEATLTVARPRPGGPLASSAMLIVNPPWRLDHSLEALLPFLAKTLARDDGATSRLRWLRPEGTGL